MTLDLDQQKLHVQNILRDTGYCCRELLGWNYDEEESVDGVRPGKRFNIGTGGIRDNGPHKEAVEFIDDLVNKEKLLLMVREGYKSTMAQGFIVRHILGNSDIKILYGMKDQVKLKSKMRGIRAQLERRTVTELFGEQKGKPWTDTAFSVATRTELSEGIMENTVDGFSLKAFPTGGHYHIIILDDMVDWDNIHTAEGMDLVMRCWKMCQPLLLAGGIMMVIGTPYAEGDLYWTIERKLGDLFKVLKIDAGVTVETNDDGVLELHGKPRFAHLTKERLYKKLRGMEYPNFCSQYLLKIVAGIQQPFKRTDFITIPWDPQRMANWTGYLLTDTASTQRKENSYGVVGYVLIAPSGDPYVVDIRLGHFTPSQFVQTFFEVLMRWQNKVNHQGEALEVNQANNVYRVNLEREAERQAIRLNLILISRGGSNDDSKDNRIARLQPRFANGEIFWLTTIPSVFIDVAEQRTLFHPTAYRDPETNIPLPDGELVSCFTSWPTWPNKDLPDMLADIEAIDKFGERLIKFVHPSLKRRRRMPRRGDSVLDRLTRGYRGSEDPGVIPVNEAFGVGQDPSQSDYFSRKHKALYGD